MDQMLSAAQFQYFTRQQIEPSIYTLVYCISHMEALMQHMSDPAGTPVPVLDLHGIESRYTMASRRNIHQGEMENNSLNQGGSVELF